MSACACVYERIMCVRKMMQRVRVSVMMYVCVCVCVCLHSHVREWMCLCACVSVSMYVCMCSACIYLQGVVKLVVFDHISFLVHLSAL